MNEYFATGVKFSQDGNGVNDWLVPQISYYHRNEPREIAKSEDPYHL